MSIYTIIIKADDADSETVIRVDGDGPTPRIVELAVRAGKDGISTPELPAFDVGMLLQALVPGTQRPAAAVRPRTRGAKAADEPATTAATPERSARSTLSRGAGTATSRRLGSGSDKPGMPNGRVYRRMPDDVVEVYNRVGTVTAMAQHFGVPRHTAQGWISRVRRQGGLSATT